MNMAENKELFTQISQLIQESKQKLAISVNAEMSALYWNVGKLIKTNVLNNARAEYGKQIIKKLSLSLSQAYGKGWSEKQLQHCLRSAEVFTDAQIFSALRRKLSWTHIKTIMYIKSNHE